MVEQVHRDIEGCKSDYLIGKKLVRKNSSHRTKILVGHNFSHFKII